LIRRGGRGCLQWRRTQRFDGLYSSRDERRGGAGLWADPGRDRQDVPLFRATRLCAVQVAGTAEARTSGSGDRCDPGSRQDGAAQAATHGEADFRTAADRTWLRRQLHGGEGLRADRPRPIARGLRPARPSARPRAGRFRRMHRCHRRLAHEAACVLFRPAAVGRPFSQCLSGGD
jgi:hypothetical protein